MTRALTFGLGALIAVLVLFFGAVLAVDAAQKDRIADGVTVASVDVGGMSRDEARARIDRLQAPLRKAIVATYGGRRYVLRPSAAGVRLNSDATAAAALERSRAGNVFSRVFGGDVDAAVRPRLDYSRAAVAGFVARVAARVDRPAREADIDMRDGKLVTTRARKGIEVQRRAFSVALVSLLTNADAKRTVKVPVRVTERPQRTLVDLAKRYPVVIGVDRDAKVLRVYESLRLARRYPIAVGQAGLETAAGRYEIEVKEVNPTWHVPDSDWAGELAGQTIAPDDPRNPLEARWMGFFDGQGIHGTEDLASLGTAASHGCIRMSVPAVKDLYERVKVGTPVFLQ